MMYDQFGSRIAAAYEMFSVSLVGAFTRSLLGRGVTRASVTEFQVACLRLQETLLSAAKAESHVYEQQLGHWPDLMSFKQREHDMLQSLRVLSFGNIAEMMGRFRKSSAKSVGMLNDGSAALQELLKRKNADALTSRDASGRLWTTATLIKVIARDFAYQAHIDATLACLKAQGDLVEVVYADPTHEGHGRVLSISGAEGFTALDSVRAGIFHPNGTAGLAHHVRTE